MKVDPREYELEEKVVHIGRISKVVKGGKKFRYSAWVVVGDQQGVVGYGHGKADEVPTAIQKAVKSARGRLIKVPIVGTSVPYLIVARYKSAKVMIKPAAPGTGIIANDKLRAIFELGGFRDVLTKCFGSKNPFNNIIAAYNGLLSMRTPEEFAELRGKSIEEILKARRKISDGKDA
jgi:small subunit ribosomal protein S5